MRVKSQYVQILFVLVQLCLLLKVKELYISDSSCLAHKIFLHFSTTNLTKHNIIVLLCFLVRLQLNSGNFLTFYEVFSFFTMTLLS